MRDVLKFAGIVMAATLSIAAPAQSQVKVKLQEVAVD